MLRRRKAILACALLTGGAWMSIGAAAWVVAHAAGIDLPFWLMSVVVVAVGLFSNTIPAPPGAVGVYEATTVFALGLFAVDPTVALTFAVVTHGLLFLPPVAIGVLGMVGERTTIKGAFAEISAGISRRMKPARQAVSVQELAFVQGLGGGDPALPGPG